MISAVHFATLDALRAARAPGGFHIAEGDDDGSGRLEHLFYYCCPCGCGKVAPILVGNGFKPTGARSSWQWNGSLDAPELSPSVNHVDHWHGWLRAGEWVLA